MSHRLLLAIGLSSYIGWRRFIKSMRRQVLALGPDEARTVARLLSTHLQVLTATDDEMKLIVRFLRRTKEMA